MDALSRQEANSDKKPQTDDELHAWIKDNLGMDIPRVAVCPHHNAPFDPIADLFFKRTNAAIVVANRGGGKTDTSAVWQFLNMRFEPEVECASVAAVEIQAKRAYQYFKGYQRKAASEAVLESKITETVWKTGFGDKYEILTGSLASVNGPHPQRVHRDEVELMDKRVYQESLQMEASKLNSNNDTINVQTLVTSTRKTSDGLMQELLDECKEAVETGRRPPFTVYQFCVKEVIQNQSDICRVANPDLPDELACDCHLVQKGEFEEGNPRTLDKICNGAFAKSGGFKPLQDIQHTFVTSSPAMWDAQQECKRPYTEDISFENLSRERHGIYDFIFDPENGPVYQGIDVGGTSPHAIEWGQLLHFEIEVTGYDGEPKRIPEGSIVMFKEIYVAEIGNLKLADLIVATERNLARKFGKFKVSGRFADPQAKLLRLDFKDHNPPLKCSWPIITRDREEHFKRLNDRINDDTFFFVVDECQMFIEEAEVWNINKNRKEFDHAVDSSLYLVSNIEASEKIGIEEGKKHTPSTIKKVNIQAPNPFNDSIPGVKGSKFREVEMKDEKWRANFQKNLSS